MTEADVYQFYNERVKLLYSEIEARYNSLPIELLFEIFAAFDHLKRFHVDGDSETLCAGKAYSHLKRGLLDAFKLKLKYHNTAHEQLMRSKADLRLLDSGRFLPNLLNDRREIVANATLARLQEKLENSDAAFDKWFEVSLSINDFEEKYFDPAKLQWAKRYSFFRITRSFVIGLITGILGSGIVALIVYFATNPGLPPPP